MKRIVIHITTGTPDKATWKLWRDTINDTMHNAATQHVPKMLRYVQTQLTRAEEVQDIQIFYEGNE